MQRAACQSIPCSMQRAPRASCAIVCSARLTSPGSAVTIATDIICGFPTESDDDFAETLKVPLRSPPHPLPYPLPFSAPLPLPLLCTAMHCSALAKHALAASAHVSRTVLAARRRHPAADAAHLAVLPASRHRRRQDEAAPVAGETLRQVALGSVLAQRGGEAKGCCCTRRGVAPQRSARRGAPPRAAAQRRTVAVRRATRRRRNAYTCWCAHVGTGPPRAKGRPACAQRRPAEAVLCVPTFPLRPVFPHLDR